MMEKYAKALCDAVAGYSYPKVTYDFENNREAYHENMRQVEETIKSQLLSKNLEEVKDGLSNVLYWGRYRMEDRNFVVCQFRLYVDAVKQVDDSTIKDISHEIRTNPAPRLENLTKLGVLSYPFKYMSFVSKL